MARSTTKELTSGSPMKLILGFAVPLLLGMLFQQFYSLMDTIIACDKTVANAAPKTPQCRQMIKNRSSPIFKTAATIRKMTGVMESPRERR